MTLSEIADVLDSQPIKRSSYSICTIVSRIDDYSEMQRSFISHGFDRESTQFIVADNSRENSFDAFSAYNLFISECKGDYIILCHQDVVLLEHDRKHLDNLISEMNELDPNWGLLGNAGRTQNNVLVSSITDPHNPGGQVMGGPLPRQVVSLDENFIVTKRSANLALSHNLSGFHYYGSDICIIASVLGLSAYVIDFHLCHRSSGFTDKAFFKNRSEIQMKFRKAFKSRTMHVTTGHSFVLSGLGTKVFADKIRRRINHIIYKLVG